MRILAAIAFGAISYLGDVILVSHTQQQLLSVSLSSPLSTRGGATDATATADAADETAASTSTRGVAEDDNDLADEDVIASVKRRRRLFDRVRTVSRSLRRQQQKQQHQHDAILDADAPTSTTSTTAASIISTSIASSTSTRTSSSTTTNDDNNTMITPQSDLMRPGRHMTIVTTAALPWMTGTAVNPLLRAAHLVRLTRSINNNNSNTNNNNNDNDKSWVTLVIPWLELKEDREELYPHHDFETPADQEAYLRSWLANEADMPDVADDLRIVFYPGRYHKDLKSIFAMGDITHCLTTTGSSSASDNSVDDDNSNNNSNNDTTDNIRNDICILEEPEHLNWFRAPGEGWSTQFTHVVGIVHTNYKDYASSQYHGLWTAPALAMISSAMVRAYCHKVIKLSNVLQTFAPEKEATANVHGVRSEFIKEGMRRANHALQQAQQVQQQAQVDGTNGTVLDPKRGIYFIGKIIWQKGFESMLEMQDYYKQCTGDYFPIHIYGSGSDQAEITRAHLGRRTSKKQKISASTHQKVVMAATAAGKEGGLSTLQTFNIKALGQLEKIKQSIRDTAEEFDLPKSLHELRRQPIPATFPGRIDHAQLKEDYSIFVNPSVSEVLCTTTAEALAMGKFVIIPVHPSNTFFLQFPNCLAYRTKLEFVANLRWAQSHDPEPLSPALRHQFTWEAATERLVASSGITVAEAPFRYSKLDQRIAWFHKELGKGERGDTIRKVLGAGPVSQQVKYQEEQQIKGSGDASDDDADDASDDGFSRQFFGSSISHALRTTLANNGLGTHVVPGVS